jgi:hypothetical protein
MAWVVIATAVVSTAVSIHGQRQSAKAQGEAIDYQNEMQRQQAKWNSDQLNKQANADENTAQENMRRERDNNKRELARRRAVSARGGLAESGAVTDNLIEASSRHQSEIDDIWEKASTQSHQKRASAHMGLWESAVNSAGLDFQKSAMQSAAKTQMWTTGIQGAGKAGSAAAKHDWSGK